MFGKEHRWISTNKMKSISCRISVPSSIFSEIEQIAGSNDVARTPVNI